MGLPSPFRASVLRWLDSPRAPLWASAASLVIGLVFAFVRAPHPWGWEGIDQYHELAQALARGEPFGTTDVPWGYAYFVAFFYAIFGPHAWLPVLAQVIANAAAPLLLYRLVEPMTGARTAALAAALAGVFSFNTIYASTLASDAICTVLFLAALVSFARGERTEGVRDFIWSGLLFGLVPQFRPNLILLPGLIALAYVLLKRRGARPIVQMAAFLALVTVALTPWTLRNYTLTGRLLPTSTHGGIQLWYGSLQVGPYLESRAYNPRSAYETASFDYTSLANDSIIVSAVRGPCTTPDTTTSLMYWTDRDRTPRRLPAAIDGPDVVRVELPGQPAPTAIYYSLEATQPGNGNRPATTLRTPLDGDINPYVYFVSDDHLGDLDRHDDLLDVFDLVRLMRHVAWQEPLPNAALLDRNGDAAITIDDLRATVVRLLGDGATLDVVKSDDVLRWDDRRLVLTLADGSSLTVDRARAARITDFDVRGTLASTLVFSRRPWKAHSTTRPEGVDSCLLVADVRVNDVFYRREVHEMNRYLALASDNISREPMAFARASLYRIGRLFVLRGASDTRTAHQFAGSGLIYGAGLTLSIAYLLVFLAGVAVAFARRSRIRVLLLPIAYVPITICFVLTNMRYTITVQPLMFAFVALALVAAFRLEADNRTAGG
jgi:hypothetical protein